jgi:hypothetical protein
LLLEGAGTNLLLNSATLATQTVTVTSGASYALAFSGTGSVAISGGYVGTLVGTGTGTANRVSLIFTATTASLTFTVTGTVSNAQAELSYPTSYIPTTTAQVTRSADVSSSAQTTRVGDSVSRVFGDEFNQDEFSVYIFFKFNEAQEPDGERSGVFGLQRDAATTNNSLILTRDQNRSNLTVRKFISGAVVSNYNSTISIGDAWTKVCLTYKNGEAYLYINGINDTPTPLAFEISDILISSFTIGSDNINGYMMDSGYVKDFQIFPKALSSAEAIALTS